MIPAGWLVGYQHRRRQVSTFKFKYVGQVTKVELDLFFIHFVICDQQLRRILAVCNKHTLRR